ncbi:hypothetical protein EYZ11_013228 [Aspergillus tanneri]|uniref:Uncharacterized protein n=1 Tax=Aspergillus tanneri TaxID=1220188 RepID=A0A4S3J0B0_9EURO|nr:hypothetical protein EYZ11_013228 [Aspergillus tanneri]
MSQTVNDPSSKALAKTFYYYRGLMIRSLNEDLSVVKKRTSDIVLAGILTLLFADQRSTKIQQGISQSWRFHIEAVRRLLVVRGGMHSVAVSHGVLPMILCFVYLAVTADTSSPASDLLIETLPIEELYLLLGKYGGNGYAFQMCPTPLFVEIAKINHLRARASKAGIIGDLDLQEEACEILRRVYDFSPVEWTKANGPLEEAKIFFFNILQKAVALYCMSSLQNLCLFPQGSPLSNSRYTERELLYGLLSQAFGPLSSLGLKGYLLWPTMVLGVEAVDGGAVMRFFVQRSLIELSVSRGTYSPLAAKEVLESFWASDKTGWDACFDQPYMFTTVLTVNRGQMVK